MRSAVTDCWLYSKLKKSLSLRIYRAFAWFLGIVAVVGLVLGCFDFGFQKEEPDDRNGDTYETEEYHLD